MIIVSIIGGLGNQMSQVAYAALLSRKYGQKLLIDSALFKDYSIRPYSVYKCELDAGSIGFYNGEHEAVFRMMKTSQKVFHHVFRLLKGDSRQLGRRVFGLFASIGHYYSFDSDCYGYPLCKRKNIDIYGYFLAYDYYSGHEDYLRKIFSIKKEFISSHALDYIAMIKTVRCPVAVSMRLQDDYVKDPAFNVCTKYYFETAISIIKQKCPDPEWFVFADDIERAKNFGLDIDAVYIENVTDVEGMEIMRNCRHFVISNSSFSWWASFLGESADKIIIAPDKWMNNNKDYSAKYYDRMIKVPAVRDVNESQG